MKLFGSGKIGGGAPPQFASSGETLKRAREVQILVNLIEPDTRYQPLFVSDEAGPLDICNLEESDIRARLGSYFRENVGLEMRVPLWRLVDSLKSRYPWWPDDRPWEHK